MADIEDADIKKVADEVQVLIDQAKRGKEDQPPKKGKEDQPPKKGKEDQPPKKGKEDQPPKKLKRVEKMAERTRQTARKSVEEEEDEEEGEEEEEEEEVVVPKSKKPKKVVISLDQEEEEDQGMAVSQNVLMKRVMNEIQRLGDQLKSRSQDQDSLVLPSTFNWKTTERNVKQIHGIRRTLSGSFSCLFLIVCVA